MSVLWGTVYRREWLPHEDDVRCTTVPAPPKGTVDPLGCWSASPGGLEIQFKRDFQPFAPIAARYAELAILPVIGAFGIAMLIKWIIGFRMAPGEGAVTMPLADLLSWHPRVRREPDGRGEVFDAGGDLPQPTAMMPEWIVRAAADDIRAERDARREWGPRRRLRWAAGRKR